MLWLLLLLIPFSPTIIQGISNEIVTVQAKKVTVRKGKAGMINLEVQVKEGYHIQAFEVADEFLVPTKLEFTSPDDFTLESAVFPPSKKFQLEGTDTYLDVYDEQFEILVPFDSKKSIRNGSYRLDGKLTYQACDSVRCLFPRSVEFHIDVQVR